MVHGYTYVNRELEFHRDLHTNYRLHLLRLFDFVATSDYCRSCLAALNQILLCHSHCIWYKAVFILLLFSDVCLGVWVELIRIYLVLGAVLDKRCGKMRYGGRRHEWCDITRLILLSYLILRDNEWMAYPYLMCLWHLGIALPTFYLFIDFV